MGMYMPEGIAGPGALKSLTDQPEQDALDAQARREIARLLSFQGLPTSDDLYNPQAKSINAQSFNLAGAQAASLASRGLSRSSFQQGASQDVQAKRGAALASAKMDSDKQAYDMRQKNRDTAFQMQMDLENRQRERVIAKQKQDIIDTQNKENEQNAKSWTEKMGDWWDSL